MASRSVTCFRNLHYFFFFSTLWCSSEVSNINILISSLTDRHWVSLSDQCYTKLVTGKGRSSAQSSLFTQRLRPTDTCQTLAFTPHRKCTPGSSWSQSSCEVQACLERPHEDSDCCSPQTGPCGTRTAQVPNTRRAQPSGRCQLGL